MLQAINEALDTGHIPVQVVEGFVGNITVSIPWSALVSDNTKMSVTNLEITVQPKNREYDTGEKVRVYYFTRNAKYWECITCRELQKQTGVMFDLLLISLM